MSGPASNVDLSVRLTGLTVNTTYRWVFCGSPNDGGTYLCFGPNGTPGSTTADPPPDYDTFTTLPQRTLAEGWDGTSWTILSPLSPASHPVLTGVSCTSATACTAVGSYSPGSTSLPLAERRDGSTWTIQPMPTPSTATFSTLTAVSCTSVTSCTAVGSYIAGSGSATLAERWDGTGWTIQPTPAPVSGGPFQELDGVSCTSDTACTAVGESINFQTNANTALVERWDGTSWTAEPTPTPGGRRLHGVSCSSATACTAVGGSADGSTLAEVWDGSTWTVQPTPGTGLLQGVSCTSTTACTAVGYSGAGTLAERWDGSAWTIQPTPAVSNAQLLGVSCTAATACEAVGKRPGATGGYTHTLTEGWNGTTWSLQPNPPPIGKFANLNSVSCTRATACTAVGNR